MKKKTYSYLTILVVVMVAAVFLSLPVAAQDASVTVIIDPVDGGTVNVSDPAGASYVIGERVTLQAVPAAGFAFSGWSDTLGAVTGSSESTDFEVAGHHVITARFTQLAPTCFTLTAIPNPLDGGMISYPSGDDGCPGDDQYIDGANISLSASASNGYQFDQWTGDLPGSVTATDPTIEILMDQNRTVNALFVKACQPLILSKNNENGADLTALPTQSTGCGLSYYKAGESITLTANADEGWKVASWDVGAANDPTSTETYLFEMPPLPSDSLGLTIQVNYEEKATFGFTTTLSSADEDAGTAVITVARKAGTLPDAATIQYTTIDGTAKSGLDYEFQSGDLSFAKNQNSRDITIDLIDDNIAEEAESFLLELSNTDPNVKLGDSSTEIEINDDEGEPTVRFEESVYTINESSTSIVVAVTVFPLPNSGDVFVDFSTQNGTATGEEDYAPISGRTLRIPSGESRKTIRITLLPDDLDELDEETVLLKLSNPSNAILPEEPDAVLKILDDDLPPMVGFSMEEYFVKKTGNDSASIPIELSELSGRAVIVDYKVTLERTGSNMEGSLTLDGVETQNLEVPISSAVADDVFALQLTNPQNAELGTINAARLYVLSTDVNDCHDLQFTFSGYGQAPVAANKTSSVGCPSGQYVAGELIDIVAQPEYGWRISGWQGTIDDESTSSQNAVEMPDSAFTVGAAYRIPIFFSIVNKAENPFNGPDEEEPNGLFSQANGPLLFDKDYEGTFADSSDINDLFFFVLTQETNVTITLQDIPAGRDYDLVLYDETWIDGKSIAVSREFDNDPEKISKTLPGGRYFIQVYAGGSDPSTSEYRLKVQINN